MHFENISTRVIKNDWTKIEFRISNHTSLFEIHCDLRRYKSRGRFKDDDRYVKDGQAGVILPVWFELKEDATYFALKYTV